MNGHYLSCPAYNWPTYSACHCTSIQISLDDLRAKVAALRDGAAERGKNGTVHPNLWTAYVDAYNHVLALFDGGSE